MTNSEVVSRVLNDNRLLNIDEHISKRFVLNIAMTNAHFLISQKLSERKLYKNDSIFRTLSCFEMEEVDVIKCDILEFRQCDNLMRSKYKLPETIYSNYGSGVVSVTSIDGRQKFTPITLNKYILNRGRKINSNFVNKNYYIKDSRLYLIDSTLKSVNVVLIPKKEYELVGLSGCKDEHNFKCKSSLDFNFICPDGLLNNVINATVSEIANIYRRITPDENPNMDENIRTKTTM